MAPSPLVRCLLRSLLNGYKWLTLRYLSIKQLLLGDTSTRESERRLQTGQAWDEFCDTLKAAGASVLAPGVPLDPLTLAEGYRYLSRLTRAGLENFVECVHVEAPQMCAIANGSRAARICIGSDNPDNLYEHASLDARFEYEVSGTRGTVSYLSLGTQSGSYGSRGGLATVDLIEAEQLQYEPDGLSFRIALSARRPNYAVNWLRLDPDATNEAMFIVRQTFGDRSKEAPATLSIRCKGISTCTSTSTSTSTAGNRAPNLLTAEKLDHGLQQAAVFVAGASALFAKWAYEFKSNHTNQLPMFDPERSTRSGGDPNIRYYHSYWNLHQGQVLRIHFRPPPCRSWNFQLNNHWMESLDYRYHKIHTNSTLARPDQESGSTFTIIVSEKDPNSDGRFRGNWIETVGHDFGTMCFRWVAPKVSDNDLPAPLIQVVTFEEIFR